MSSGRDPRANPPHCPFPVNHSNAGHGLIDAFPMEDLSDESCSICLDPFSEVNPSTVTTCKHEFHLQCVLDWAQRSKECPMCWQKLELKDPDSQELLDAIKQELPRRISVDGNLSPQVPSFSDEIYSDFEERLMRRLAHELSIRGINRFLYMPNNDEARNPSSDAIVEEPSRSMDAALHEYLDRQVRTQRNQMGEENNMSSSQESVEGRHWGNLEVSTLSSSLKSRVQVASSRCKETITRTTRNLKEKWGERNISVAGFRARVQEASTEVLRRISPEPNRKEIDSLPTTSSGSFIQDHGLE